MEGSSHGEALSARRNCNSALHSHMFCAEHAFALMGLQR